MQIKKLSKLVKLVDLDSMETSIINPSLIYFSSMGPVTLRVSAEERSYTPIRIQFRKGFKRKYGQCIGKP